ncbi:hypothetical protein QUF76_10735 [Desulfobacterales bacterium HSG16]|nr:hypothetical protein [Desulfobacterales bacterium HSG16]
MTKSSQPQGTIGLMVIYVTMAIMLTTAATECPAAMYDVVFHDAGFGLHWEGLLDTTANNVTIYEAKWDGSTGSEVIYELTADVVLTARDAMGALINIPEVWAGIDNTWGFSDDTPITTATYWDSSLFTAAQAWGWGTMHDGSAWVTNTDHTRTWVPMASQLNTLTSVRAGAAPDYLTVTARQSASVPEPSHVMMVGIALVVGWGVAICSRRNAKTEK